MSRKLYNFNKQQSKIKHQDKRNEKLNRIYVVQPAHGTVQDRSS